MLAQELEVPVKDLSLADCPPSSRAFYENIPIVYTWVDGSDPGYAGKREQYGGKAAVGGARDRDSGELRFSLRSLATFLPVRTKPPWFCRERLWTGNTFVGLCAVVEGSAVHRGAGPDPRLDRHRPPAGAHRRPGRSVPGG